MSPVYESHDVARMDPAKIGFAVPARQLFLLCRGIKSKDAKMPPTYSQFLRLEYFIDFSSFKQWCNVVLFSL